MADSAVESEILENLRLLDPSRQKQVLDYLLSMLDMQRNKAVRKKNVLDLIGQIDHQELDSMKSAIEESCERVDPNEW